MEQLIPFILKSLLLAGAALGLLRLLRDRSAAARGVVAHLALLALVLMPVANLLLPPLSVAVPGLTDRMVPAAALDGPVKTSPAAGSPATTSDAVGATDLPALLPADDLVILAYALPALLLLFITLLATGRLFLLRARAGVLEDTVWLDALARAQGRMGVMHRTTLLISDDLPSPISWGLLRPVILLDRETLRLHDQAEAIIAHELAHIAAFDWARLLFARVATALYWFNPLVWILAREAHQLREEAADDAVLAAQIIDTDYAQLLLRTARHEYRGPALTAHGVAPSRHSLARRIRRVLDANMARCPVTRAFAFCITAGTLALAAPVAALSFEASGASAGSVERRTLPAIVMNTVSTATTRSADMICAGSAPAPIQSVASIQSAGTASRVEGQSVGARQKQPASNWVWPNPAEPAQSLSAPQVAEQRQREMDQAELAASGGYGRRTASCTSTATLVCDEAGRGIVARNTTRAARILSADDGPWSKYDLANLYLTGQGVPQDSARAVALYRQAAEAGYSPAMLGLARVLEGGQGVPPDKAELDNWYRRWASADDKLYPPEVRARILAERNIQPVSSSPRGTAGGSPSLAPPAPTIRGVPAR